MKKLVSERYTKYSKFSCAGKKWQMKELGAFPLVFVFHQQEQFIYIRFELYFKLKGGSISMLWIFQLKFLLLIVNWLGISRLICLWVDDFRFVVPNTNLVRFCDKMITWKLECHCECCMHLKAYSIRTSKLKLFHWNKRIYHYIAFYRRKICFFGKHRTSHENYIASSDWTKFG